MIKSFQIGRRTLALLGHLKHAAVFSGMLFGVQATHAAVIYYKPDTRIRLHNFTDAHQDYNLDINGDGVFDLQHDSVGAAAFLRSWGETRILGLKQPYVNVTWYDSVPYALTAGSVIGAESPALFPEYGNLSGWQSHPIGVPGAAALHVRYDSGTSGFFVGNRGFIGIEFLVDERVHYGWIDLDSYSWMQSEIHGWAYESEPGKPIIAGAIPESSSIVLTFCGVFCLVARRKRAND